MLNLAHASLVRKVKTNFTSARDMSLFMRVFILITFLPVLTRYLSIPTLLKRITPKTKAFVTYKDDDEFTRKLVKYTDFILARKFAIYHPNCLRRSLILFHFLRKAGVRVQICLGAKFSGETDKSQFYKTLKGHAWLKHDGKVILERKNFVLQQYKITYQFPIV